jgi:hypothetical protein
MKPSVKRRVGGAALVAVMVVAGSAAAVVVTGSAPAATAGASAGTSGLLRVRVNLTRFQADQKHHRLIAHGSVVTSYLMDGKVQATNTKAVLMQAQQGTTCRVLHLELGELHLSLLGLIVNLTPVDDPSIVLDISANSDEALGKLLCQVINAVQGTTVRKTTLATKRLNAVVKKQYSAGVMSFSAPLSIHSGLAGTTTGSTATTATTTTTTTTTTPSTPQTGQCDVLDLVLGPLNLDLLGLIVSLNKVQLDISANPVGTLGTLFCQLAGSTTAPLTLPVTTGAATTSPTTATTSPTTTAGP